MKLFVDTWGWVVLKDPNESRHKDAVACFEAYRDHPRGIVTSDYVLNEAFTRIFSQRPFQEAWLFTEGIMAAAAAGDLAIEMVGFDRFRRALGLRRRYADKPRISFTDLTSMVIMKELDIESVLTADEHFSKVGLGFRLLPE